MRHPLAKVIEALNKSPDSIYVWVITQPGRTENTSIRISWPVAVEWCINYANTHNGEVPCYFLIGGGTIFLGYAPV